MVWCVGCGVWVAVCGVWCVVCGVWCVVCEVQGVGCGYTLLLAPYISICLGPHGGPRGGGLFLMSEVSHSSGYFL